MNETTSRDYVTVVSGLPRSGTSMMMRMLGAGGLPVLTDERRASDEDNPRGYFELEAVKRLDADNAWLGDAVGKVVKIIHMLLPSLPADCPCRVVFMERDLQEVIASQAVMLKRRGQEGAAVDADTLAGVFARQLRATYDWMASQPNLQVLKVSYAATVADPAPTIDALCAFLQPPSLDAGAMQAAVDPSLYRQRGPGG
jgi:hypothetical protein